MSKAKPIFLVQLPVETVVKDIIKITEKLTEKLSDYHVLVVFTSVNKVEFTAFYDKDLIEVDFNNFKEMVMNQINQIKLSE